MIRRLDRYVVSYFISSFCVALFFLVGLYSMIDAVGKVDEFVQAAKILPEQMRSQVPGYVLRYYLLSAPYYYLQFAPFIALLAVLFAGVRLAQSNELVPMVSAGVSLFRIAAPLFIGATLVTVSMLVIRERVIPRVDDLRDSLRDILMNQRSERVYNDIMLIKGNTRLLCQHFVPANGEIQDIDIRITGPEKNRSRITAKTGVYRDGESGVGWYLAAGRKTTHIGGDIPSNITFLEGVQFTPKDLFLAYKAKEFPVELSFEQLNQLSLWEPERADYMTLLHYFLTFPLMALILPLLGLPFVLRFQGRASSEGIGIAFFIFLAYFAVDFYLRGLGNQGHLHPLMASWLPVVLFGSLGIILFESIRT